MPTGSAQSFVSVPVSMAPVAAAPVSTTPVTVAPISTAPTTPPPRTELSDVGCIRRIAFRDAGLDCFGSDRIPSNGLSIDGRPIKRPCVSRRQELRPREYEYSRQSDTRQRVAPGQYRRVVVAVASTPQDFASFSPIHDRSLRRTVASAVNLKFLSFRSESS
jgi:hypothetical protein